MIYYVELFLYVVLLRYLGAMEDSNNFVYFYMNFIIGCKIPSMNNEIVARLTKNPGKTFFIWSADP